MRLNFYNICENYEFNDEKTIIGDYILLFNKPSFPTFSVPIFASGMSILRRPLEYILKSHYKKHFNYFFVFKKFRYCYLILLLKW